MVFANRVALITGAGSGLGRELARLLAREGAAVAAVDLQPGPLAALEAELPGRPVAWAVADVTDRPALNAAVGKLQARLGPIDLLIASAGIGRETSAEGFRAEDVEDMVRVNLVGVANSIAAVLPGMIERRRGHLVGISSLASFRGVPRLFGYCASKAGVNALLDGLRMDLRPHGVAVTTVCPGFVRTPMTATLTLARGRVMEVEAAARHIAAAVRRRQPFCAFPPGAAWRMRLLRWLPCGLSDWAAAHFVRSLTRD